MSVPSLILNPVKYLDYSLEKAAPDWKKKTKKNRDFSVLLFGRQFVHVTAVTKSSRPRFTMYSNVKENFRLN
jgi:hypothetical protein